MLHLAPLSELEPVPQAFDDFALADGIGQDTASLKKCAGCPAQLFLGRDDGPLCGGDGKDGRLELAGLGGVGLQVRQPAQLLTGSLMRCFHNGDGALMEADGAAEFDAGRLFCHLAKTQNNTEAEPAAHRGSPRSIDGRALAAGAGCG